MSRNNLFNGYYLAKFISTVGHPLLTLPVFILTAMLSSGHSKHSILISIVIIGGIFIPLILRMFIKSRNGSYTNFDVSNQKQRYSLFTFAIPLLSCVTLLLFLTHQSINLNISILFALLLAILSYIINFRIKSSLHVSLNIYLSALIFTTNAKLGIFVFLFTALLGWSRVKLGRHTFKEVVCGAIIGVFISTGMLLTEKFL